jgi:hypothetical protein
VERREFLGRGLAVSAATLGSSLLRLRPAGAEARAVSVVFSDSFKRKATPKGWGKAWFNQRYGIPWGIAKKKGFYDLPAPQPMALAFAPNPVLVRDRDVLDSSAVATLSADNAGARFGLVARAVGYGDYYGAYLGPAGLTISRFSINREEILSLIPFAVDPRARYLLRFAVSGASAVALKAKVWKAGTAEPSRWTTDARDAEAGKRIEKPGASGFLFMHDARRENAARVKVSKYKLESPSVAAETPPTLSFSYAGRVEDGKVRLVAKTDVPAAEILFHVGTDPQLARRYTAIPADEILKKQGIAKAWMPAPPPGGTFYWRVATKTKSGDRLRSRVHAVRTPVAGGEVTFAFGSCTHFWPVSRSFEVAAGANPSFFAHLGDLGYPQDRQGGALGFRSDAFQDRWTRMLGRRTTARLHETSQWVALQDDHDYGADNAYRDDVKPFTIKAFDQISGNLGERHFDMRRGDVHAFFVDVHVDADDPERVDEPDRSLLGGPQKAWLKDAMRASDAPLLVVFSSMPLWGLGLGFGSWKEGFADERRELVSFFQSLQGAQRRVIVCSGNAHAQYVNRHTNPGGKDLIEFVSSGTDRIDSTGATPVQVHSSDDVVDRSRATKLIDAFGLVTLQGAGAARRVVIRSIESKTGQNVWAPLELDL